MTKDKREFLLVLFLLIVVSSLRLVNLGYSEYIPDESTVLYPLRELGGFSWDFLLNQRKGPLQFLIAEIVYIFYNNLFNELVFRIPFAIANTLAILAFYKFLKNITNSIYVAFFGAIFLGVNGFTVAFGRIVQYQSLNLLFSSLSLYFYSLLLVSKKDHIISSLLGTIFFCFSILSHWDAIFILPFISYVLFRLLGEKSITKKEKVHLIAINIYVLFILLAPFYIPFFSNYLRSESNQSYISTRFGFDIPNFELISGKLLDYVFRIELYNPFILLPFLIVIIFIALLTLRESKFYLAWLIFTIVFFLIFIKNPGTHVYNLFIPLYAFASFGIKWLLERTKFVGFGLLSVALLFLTYQSYLLFVDYSKEYPWEQERIYKYKTSHYNHKNLTNYIIGFPIRRGWLEVNEFIMERNSIRGETLSYITNETKSLSNFYMSAPYGKDDKYYAVGIKRPYSFTTDYKFPQIKNKSTIHKVEIDGENVIRIYLVGEDQFF